MSKLRSLLVCIAITSAAAVASADSPKDVLKRALAPRADAIARCGNEVTGKSRAVARFEFAEDGRAQNVQVEGLTEFPAARECLVRQFSELRVPAVAAAAIEKVRLPLAIR